MVGIQYNINMKKKTLSFAQNHSLSYASNLDAIIFVLFYRKNPTWNIIFEILIFFNIIATLLFVGDDSVCIMSFLSRLESKTFIKCQGIIIMNKRSSTFYESFIITIHKTYKYISNIYQYQLINNSIELLMKLDSNACLGVMRSGFK